MASHRSVSSLAAEGVCGLQPYVTGKPLDELEREYGIKNAIKLASNENPCGPSPAVLEAVRKAATELHRYPDGNGFYLKQALAEHLEVATATITLGNGSNDILVLLAETFLTARTNAVYSDYCFLVYPLAVQATGAEARVAPANAVDHEQPLGHDLDAMLSLIDDDTRLVFVANPNNPTGTWAGAAALRRFLLSVPEHVIVVLDEAYYEYAVGGDYPDVLPWLDEFPNLVITRTFSKIYGLAGLRVGYALSHPDIAELLNRVRQPFNVNSLALVAAETAVKDHASVSRSRSENTAGIAQLSEALTALGFVVLPSKGNFVLVDVGESALVVYDALLRSGVIVRPVANYGLPNYLRVTVGSPAEIERLLSVWAKLRSDQNSLAAD